MVLYEKLGDTEKIKQLLDKGVLLFKNCNSIFQKHMNIGLDNYIIKLNQQYNNKNTKIYNDLALIIKEILNKAYTSDIESTIMLYELLIGCYDKEKKQDSKQSVQQDLYNYYNGILEQSVRGVKQRYLEEMIKLSRILQLSNEEKFKLQQIQKEVGKEFINKYAGIQSIDP